IGLFTQEGASPAAVAAFCLDRGLDRYEAWVGENLGAADERISSMPLPDLIGRRFADLNYLILLGNDSSVSMDHARASLPRTSGIADDRFHQPHSGPVLLTHADVRAVTLAR